MTDAKQRTFENITATVAPFQGVPWLYINDKPFNGASYLRAIERYPGFDQYTYESVFADYKRAARQGAGLFLLNSNCASDFYERLWGDVWPASGTWDYSHVDRFMGYFAKECPGVWVMPTINLFLPQWWEDQHPEELQRFSDGRARARFSGESAAFRDQVVSLASEVWYADMTMALERYLDYVESRYGDMVPGYMVTGGITHEWGILGSFDFVDYSTPMLRYWRRWVANRYGNAAPYSAETIPSPELRLEGVGEFRDPRRSLPAIDFQLCLSDLVAERIIGFCETVKRRTQGKKIASTYYGYTLTCRESGLDCLNQFLGRYGCGGFQGGHLAMQKVLQSPAVDMITSPFSYANRRLGSGDLQPHYAETSVWLAGKISYLQDDNRSWKGKDQKGIDTGFYPEPENFLKQLRRAFARRICGDDMFYLMDLLGENYDDPRVDAELLQEQACFDRCADLRGPSVAETLIVVDEIAIAHLNLASQLQKQNVYFQSVEWARMGIPFHVVLLEDAARMDLSPYKLVIMTNLFVASELAIAVVERSRKQGCSLLYFPGTAQAGPTGPDANIAKTFTGFSPQEQRATIQPRLVIHPRPGATGIDAMATQTPLTWEELGSIGERAGCHRYGNRGERIWRSARLLGIHVNEGGATTIQLPKGEKIGEALLPAGAWRQEGDRLLIMSEPWETMIFSIVSA